jgi:F-type H+-transporting ATPase subunit epsilon
MKTFHLEIITPEKIAFSDEVEMVTAPSANGTIGVLSGHVSVFTRLIEGEVKVVTSGKEIYMAIGSGFMEISSSKSTLLVTSAYHADEINEKKVMEAKKRAEEALAAKPTGEALLEAQTIFKRSVVELKVLKRKRHTGVSERPMAS